MKDTDGKYELILLHPDKFMRDDFPLVITHPTTQRFTMFYASSDGLLHEGSTTGPPLPPFCSRGWTKRSVLLNPFLVNFAAHVRMRCLDRQIPGWRDQLHPDAKAILAEVESLQKTVRWSLPDYPSMPTEVYAEVLPHDLLQVSDHQSFPADDRHISEPVANEIAPPDSASLGTPPENRRPGIPTMKWEDAAKLMDRGDFFRAYSTLPFSNEGCAFVCSPRVRGTP